MKEKLTEKEICEKIMTRNLQFEHYRHLPYDEEKAIKPDTISDITEEVKEYITLCENSDILNAEFSKRASILHTLIMQSISEQWVHEDSEYREAFSMLLRVITPIIKRGGKFLVAIKKESSYRGEYYNKVWAVFPKDIEERYNALYCPSESEVGIISGNECLTFLEEWRLVGIASIGIAYNTGEGINHGKWLDRRCEWSDSSGIYHDPKTTTIKPEYAKKIREMGLIPIAIETGSYHENWFHLYGIYPERWDEFTKDIAYIDENGYQQ